MYPGEESASLTLSRWSPCLPVLQRPSDFDAKPMVLLLGQYSTGKTTFIKSILGKSYPGEPLT